MVKVASVGEKTKWGWHDPAQALSEPALDLDQGMAGTQGRSYLSQEPLLEDTKVGAMIWRKACIESRGVEEESTKELRRELIETLSKTRLASLSDPRQDSNKPRASDERPARPNAVKRILYVYSSGSSPSITIPSNTDKANSTPM
jgi:hypothetical protein